jgi:hypothetical protein
MKTEIELSVSREDGNSFRWAFSKFTFLSISFERGELQILLWKTWSGRYNITNSNCLQENLKEIEKLVAGPRWAPDTKTDWTGRLIVGRNVTLTLKKSVKVSDSVCVCVCVCVYVVSYVIYLVNKTLITTKSAIKYGTYIHLNAKEIYTTYPLTFEKERSVP